VRKKGLPVPKVPKKRNFWEKIEANWKEIKICEKNLKKGIKIEKKVKIEWWTKASTKFYNNFMSVFVRRL
jgi:hypothetical protein